MELCRNSKSIKLPQLNPFISICIPSYNRPESLLYLLNNIEHQNCADIEIIICEDHSPKRQEVHSVVKNFSESTKLKVQYYENQTNLGYDKNIRELITKATGDYIIFMGDDDAFIKDKLNQFITFLKKHDDLGYVLKTHVFIHKDGKEELFKYFDKDTFFEPGASSVSTLFRKSVLISGFCIKRTFCRPFLNDYFDGTLLVQLYLLAEVCFLHPSAYCSIPLTVQDEILRQTPMFGSSETEKDLYEPGTITPLNSINFMKGFFQITEFIDKKHNSKITDAVRKDFSKYSYPVLAIQRKKGLYIFLKYLQEVIKSLKIHQSIYFYIYTLGLIIFNVKFCNGLIVIIKKIIGKTPHL